jgi:hypothetical protein
MSAAAKTRTNTQANGNGKPAGDPLAEAIAYEAALAEEAAAIRGDANDLTFELFTRLQPLLRRPIPPGFIVTTPKTDGKPYPSTGIKSVQVQIDRMDNVLSPLWWGFTDTYEDEGKLCRVEVVVNVEDREIRRASWGGVNRGSTFGNLRKGSFTNAAKRALAMLGPGHEVYLGAADFDPDVDPDAAKEQAKAPGEVEPRTLPAEKVETLKATITEAGLDPFLEMKLRSFGVAAIEDLSVEQGIELWQWVQSERAGG